MPEFRISEHIENIINSGSDFRDALSDFLSLTGASDSRSSDDLTTGESFYKTYSTTDFMKYFGVVSDILDENGSSPVGTVNPAFRVVFGFDSDPLARRIFVLNSASEEPLSFSEPIFWKL